MSIRPGLRAASILLASFASWACPAGEKSGEGTKPADAEPPKEPASRPGDVPKDHNTSTTPVSLEDLFKMPETPPVVLKVGALEVKRETLENKLRQMQLQLSAAGVPEGTNRREVLQGAIDQLVEYEFTMLMAKNLGAKPDQKAVDRWVKEMEDRMEAEPAFKALLARAGNTHEQRVMDARFMVTAEAVSAKLLERMRTKTATTFRHYYDTHQSDFMQNAGVEVWRVHVKAPTGMTQKDRDASKKRAEGIHAKAVKKPKDFENLAKAFSEGGNAAHGGYLGYVGDGTFAAALQTQIVAAKPNSILPLYEDPSGYYVYKVGKRRERSVKKYEQVEPQILEIFVRGFLHKEVEKERKRLRDATKVEVFVPELGANAPR
jgi:parvulin-like peptidyl-prolyl isomerase